MIWSSQNEFLKIAQFTNILSICGEQLEDASTVLLIGKKKKHGPQLEPSWSQFAFLVIVYEGLCKITILAKA